MNSNLDSGDLLRKGEKFHFIAKIGMFAGLGGIGLAVLIGLISVATGWSFIGPFLFAVSHGYEAALFFVAVDYLALLAGAAGVGLYFYSLILCALGMIARNTEN